MKLERALLYVLLITTTTLAKTTFEKNGLTYERKNKGEYSIKEDIPILTPGIISNISDMRALSLIDQEITDVQPGAFQNLPRLKTLKLIFNTIKKIETGVFNNLSNVTNLDLSANEIVTIAPAAFHNMTRLKNINLSNNKLTQMDVHWFDLPSLKRIDLGYNLITEVPAKAFAGLTSGGPYWIFLENNQISNIDDDAFQGLMSIQVLSLDENGFTTLNGSFLHELHITELRINRNKIECIEEKYFDKLFAASVIQAYLNPWSTECLEKVKGWMKSHNKELIMSV